MTLIRALALAAAMTVAGRAVAQGAPQLSAEDKAFLHRQLALQPNSEVLCRLDRREAERLHRLIRAGDAADVQAYLANVYLDQLFDMQHGVARPDRCPPGKPF